MSLETALARVSELGGAFVPAARPAPPATASAATPAIDPKAFAGQLQSALAGDGGTAAAAAGRGAGSAGPAGSGGAPAARGNYPNLSGDLDAKPEILGKLQALAAQRGEKWVVTSGLRTPAEQQRLWDNRQNNPYPVARPGTSVHDQGRGADVTIGGRPIQSVVSDAQLRRAGLVPLKGDAVHVQLP